MADHHRAGVAGGRLRLGREDAAQHGTNAQRCEVVLRDHFHAGFQTLPLAAHEAPTHAISHHGGEGAGLAGNVAVIGERRRSVTVLYGPTGLDRHQAAGVRHRPRPQEEAIDHAEDRGIGPYPKRQRDHGHTGEAGALAQHPQPETQILHEAFDEVHTARVAALLFGAVDAAELEPCPPHGLPARQAAAHQVVRVGLDVETEFRIHLALGAGAAQDGFKRRTNAAPQPHTSSGLVRSTPAMTSAMRFHFSVSLRSRRVPAAVSR